MYIEDENFVSSEEYKKHLEMLPFDICELSNLHFSVDEMLEYYNTVDQHFQHLKCLYDGSNDLLTDEQLSKIRTMFFGLTDAFTYSIQTRIGVTSKPQIGYVLPWEEPNATEGDKFNTPTDLAFGFAKKLIDNIPDMSRFIITAHPPKFDTFEHIDYCDTVPIHIPIQTTDESWFYFGDTRYNLKVGKAYIINSLRPHRPNNLGDKHRIHLFFHIPIKNVQDLLSTEINL